MQVFRDAFAARETLAITVDCSSKQYANSDQGWCQWSGSLRDFLVHEEECSFVRVACTACAQLVERQILAQHQEQVCSARPVQCQHCNSEVMLKDLEQHQDESCPELPVACPNGCGETHMLRKSLEAHKKICPMEVVNCCYNSIGCKFVGARRVLGSHHDKSHQIHMLLVMSRMQQLESIVADLFQNLEEQRKLNQSLSNRLCVVETERDDMRQSLEQLQAGFGTFTSRHGSSQSSAARRDGLAAAPSKSTPEASKYGEDEELAEQVVRIDRSVELLTDRNASIKTTVFHITTLIFCRLTMQVVFLITPSDFSGLDLAKV